jgi:hypothetical protein
VQRLLNLHQGKIRNHPKKAMEKRKKKKRRRKRKICQCLPK